MPKIPYWIFIIIALLYFTAIGVNTMDIDASQYAEMSREMMKSGDYLHLYDRGLDYLDKPPFLFWVSAASMKVFGVNNFGYKLPSILFALWCLYATYRLARLLYDEATGRTAALVLATCQGMFLMTNDIRTDTILMAWVITAIWLIQEWYVRCKIQYLLGGAACIAFGMMTKGPLALMVPVFCFISDWALKRQWKNFYRPVYLLALLVIAILLIPMSIGLYQQFDMHPEKLIGGKTGVSGLRFFFWSQSFGRITGESPWKNGADMSFLLENMLWSFLPWILIFLTAIVMNCIALLKQKFRLLPPHSAHSSPLTVHRLPQTEWLTTGGFILSYLMFGSSAYQLPHYIFVAFPLAAIVTGRFIVSVTTNDNFIKLRKTLITTHNIISILLLLVCMLLISYVLLASGIMLALLTAGIVFVAILIFRKTTLPKLLWIPAITLIIVNFFLSNHFYPTLLKYQAGCVAGKYIHDHHIDTHDVLAYRMHDPLNSIGFYAKEDVYATDTLKPNKLPKYVLTMADGLDSLTQHGFTYDTIMKDRLFKVSELTLEFLNPATRNNETKAYYLVQLNNRRM